ncbi:MAG: pyridoxamine 5'-phosphate oxidase [Gammaproteobacteria bacterium]
MTKPVWDMVAGPLTEEPVIKFHHWYQRACDAGIKLAEKAAVATVDAAGRPSVRYVLVRAYSDEGLVFFTNYQSTKGVHLAANASVALAFHWQELGLQLRVEGQAVQADRTFSTDYFDTRPLGSRAAAIVSSQSQKVNSYNLLEQAMQQLLEQGEAAIKCPEHWGGYLVRPHSFEFWEDRQHRLHYRELWESQGAQWTKSLLAP